ncbi:MAG TPA: 5'-methylthioadenosine/adenosylhomocysteine nucleosidase, partial [Clostridiaceae bacterium]|nr:5'-methylthioadenosine/adenosylhomocysteine nucleosidase [Clostridiaceae bacterium]
MVIGIIGAMDKEINELKGRTKIDEITKKAEMEFCSGKLLDKDVVIVKSGVGKVNAAVCTQILIDS